MRPLHAVSFGLALVVVLLAAWLFAGRQGGDQRSAPTTAADRESAASGALAPETALEAPTAERLARDASVGAPPAVPSSGTVAAAGTRAGLAACALIGRVVDGAGRPVANAVVYADGAGGGLGEPLDLADPELAPWSRRVETKTGADGRFEIRPRAQSAVRLAVRASGFAPYDAERPIAGERHDVGEVVLEPSVLLAGRVIDSGGRPVVGARLLRLTAGASGFEFFGGPRGVLVATTDERGRFQVDQLASGPWKLLITSEDHPDKIEEGEVERAGASVANLEFVVADGTEIHGRVVRAPAEALKNLWVRALARSPVSDRAVLELGAATGGAASASRRARVAADGTFTLRGLVPDGAYNLSARDSERALSGRRRTQVVPAKAGDHGVELPFQPETALVFQVVDALSGEPVTELDVQAGYQWRMPMLDEAGRRVRQFPEGRVRYSNLPPPPAGEAAQVRVESVGYTPFERKDLLVTDGQDFDLGVIRLERAPVVKVRVTDAKSSAPVSGAQVILAEEELDGSSSDRRMLVNIGDEDEGLIGGGESHRARTDAAGLARVTSLPGARARILVQAPGFAPHASELIELPAASDVERDVRLTLGGSVIVEVVDSKGRPVAGVGIDHESPASAFEPLMLGHEDSDVTDAEGRVRFEHLAAGVHRFKTRDALGNTFSFGDRSVVVMRRSGGESPPEPGWSDVVVAELAVETLRFVAPTRSALTGRVTESGKPLANATLRLSEKGASEPELAFLMGGGTQARTNGKGEYQFDNVKVGDYRLSVTHATRSMPFEVDVTVREGANEFDLDLSVAIVEGRVEDRDKRPLAGVRVRAEKARAEGEPRRMIFNAVMVADSGDDESAVTFSTGDGASPEALSDADGRYRLRGVAPDVEIVVKATGKDVQPTESKVFRVAPDQVKSGVDFVLEQGGAIEVKVEHPDGRPAPSCLVRGTIEGPAAGDSEPKVELAGATGIAKLSGLKPGKWRLHVQTLGIDPESGEGTPPDQVVEVTAGNTTSARFEVP